MGEAAFQAAVIEAAQWHGWRVHAERPARRRNDEWMTPIQGDAGFPDLVLAHPKRGVIFAELKSRKGRQTDPQWLWYVALLGAGAEAYVWRPEDWDAIVERLASVPSSAVTGRPPGPAPVS